MSSRVRAFFELAVWVGFFSCGRVETKSIRVDVDAYVVWGRWRSQGYGAGALIEVDLDTH